MDITQLKNNFISTFGVVPTIFKSPGRINILGEHTDYNGGFVMPAAINKAVYVAVSLRNDEEVHLYAASYQEKIMATISTIKKTETNWANYILGVVDELLKRNYQISGFNLYIDGDVPLGAGLSSSAAVECATAYALANMNGLTIPQMELALIAQSAEHHFAGVKCGIMDQFASVFGKKNEAIMLDCRSMDYQYIPLNLEGYSLVLLNTNVKHSLADSAYNKRREQCTQGVAWVKAHHPSVNYLRDVTEEQLNEYVKPKDLDIYQKCLFVVQEIDRVRKAAESLKSGNLEELGKLMFTTHHGLSKNYEVSCKELDFLVEKVSALEYVLGARMMGGGFGGCTINIVKNEAIEQLIEELSKLYAEEFDRKLDAYVVETGDGAQSIN